jgi:hypothetical protein
MGDIVFKFDHIITGIIIGFLFPAGLMSVSEVVFRWQGMFLDYSFYENYSLFLIGLNGALMYVLTVKLEKDNLGRGLVITTLILAIAWAIKYQT